MIYSLYTREFGGVIMKVTLNKDEEIVKAIKEGLEHTGGYCPCRREHTEDNKCMSSENRLRIRTLKDTAIVCYTINLSKVNKGKT